MPRSTASASTSAWSRSPAEDEGVGAGVQHEVGNALADGGVHDRRHVAHGLVERLHLVLDVGADDPDTDGLADGLGRVAVPRLEVGRDRQRGRLDDAAHGLDHRVDGDLLAVRVAPGGGDRVAGGRDGGGARRVGDDLGADRVPHVDDRQQGGVLVQSQQLGGLVLQAVPGAVLVGALRAHASEPRPSRGDRTAQPLTARIGDWVRAPLVGEIQMRSPSSRSRWRCVARVTVTSTSGWSDSSSSTVSRTSKPTRSSRTILPALPCESSGVVCTSMSCGRTNRPLSW